MKFRNRLSLKRFVNLTTSAGFALLIAVLLAASTQVRTMQAAAQTNSPLVSPIRMKHTPTPRVWVIQAQAPGVQQVATIAPTFTPTPTPTPPAVLLPVTGGDQSGQ